MNKERENTMENKELALLAARAINEKKGIDIKIIDIAEKSSLRDRKSVV